MSAGSFDGPAGVDRHDLGSGAWRVPLALILAIASLPFAFWYGYGTVAAIASLTLAWPAWREGQRSVLIWSVLVLGTAGLLLGGFMLMAAVGLCGPGVLIGRCSP